MQRRIIASIVASASVLIPSGARADDRVVLRIATTLLPRASHAAFVAAGGKGGATAVQSQYDAARDIQGALTAASPVSPACEPLAASLASFARAQVTQAEGVDRLRPAQVAQAGIAASRSLAAYRERKAACEANPSDVARVAPPTRVDDPGSFEAFFGAVRTRAPADAVAASITLDGRLVGRAAVERDWIRTRITAAPARGRLVVTFESAAGGVVGRSVSEDVWLLPRSAAIASSTIKSDVRLDGTLSRAAAAFRGISAVYALDLTSGSEGSWNADARFPAASTVKLGVLAAALAHLGPHPETEPQFYDLRALTGWSSNLAANRLLRTIGGSSSRGAALAQDALRRLGARSSTYPGNYVVGTAFRTRPPPLVSSRVTTARDLGTALATLQRAATGDARMRAKSGLTVHQARIALGLLLSSEPTGDNLGMVREALGRTAPIAQKQGWLDDTRLTAAIVYTTRGPRVLVICAYERGLRLATAKRLGQRVVSTLRMR